MTGPAADRTRTPETTPTTSDWQRAARRRWRRVLVFLAHWRLRVASVCSLVGVTVRRAVRYGRRRSPREPRHRTGDDRVLPARSTTDVLPVTRNGRAGVSDRTETADRALPSGAGSGPALPAGNGALEVEQTHDRLTLFDPATDDAFLSSTVWVDVEE